MKKKGEAILIIGLIAIIIVGGLVMFDKIVLEKREVYYVVDTSSNHYYNLNSKNPECDIDKIKIKVENFIAITDKSIIENEVYTLDEENRCD